MSLGCRKSTDVRMRQGQRQYASDRVRAYAELLGARSNDWPRTSGGDSASDIRLTRLDFARLVPEAGPAGFMDPWGKEYNIVIDLNGDGRVAVGDQHVKGRIAVWADGPNGVDELGGGDDIASWRNKER